MDVVVFAKHIPDPSGTAEIGDDFRLKRDAEGTLDPGDEYAIEAALQLVEQHGGEVTVVSMGPDPAAGAVRKALSLGCHKAILVTDDAALPGADALATARVLAAAVQRAGFDLVLGAVESTDGSTGTVPQAVAEFLGVPAATFARKVDVGDGTVRVERQTELGYDVVECPLPALVTVTAGATEPRYPKLKDIMQAKQKPLDQVGVSDLELSAGDVAAMQKVTAIEDAPERKAGQVIEADDDTPQRVAAFLKEAKVI